VLLKDSPILVLDEPSAMLDTIFAHSAGKTLILLTHRLVMLDQVDAILVMREGRIVEQATEARLLARW
jgi:ATP-binding cassette subfamily C protein CydC